MIQLTSKEKTESVVEALIALYEENITELNPELKISVVAQPDWSYQSWVIKIWFTKRVFRAHDPVTWREDERDFAELQVPMILPIGILESEVSKILDSLKEIQLAA